MAEHTPAPYLPRSVYGYTLFIGCNMVFLLYLTWTLIPEDIMQEYLGLTFWPSKYWAVAIPIWIGTGVVIFGALVYPAINMSMTPDIDDIRTIQDKHSIKFKESPENGIPSVSDIPITEVSKRLYL